MTELICPVCKVYMREEHMFKRNVVTTENESVFIAYDAFCPNCNTELGKMNWGVFTLDPCLENLARIRQLEMEADKGDSPQPPHWQEEPPQSTKPQQPTGQGSKMAQGPFQIEPIDGKVKSGKRCPHCGEVLPSDF